MRNLLFRNFPKIFVCFTLCILFSCSKSVFKSNEVFESKYGDNVKMINSLRQDKTVIDITNKRDFTAELENNDSRYTNQNVTISEQYSTQQFYNQAPNNSGFSGPREMFDVNYAQTINTPFRKIGAEFDVIEIPPQDAYGVKVGMQNKEYLLVSRKLLQRNIDQINQERTKEDIENSNVLISEQKSLKRRARMIKIFGSNAIVEEEEKSKKSDDKNKSQKKFDSTKIDSNKNKGFMDNLFKNNSSQTKP